MREEQARDLIRKVFEEPFDKKQFNILIKNLLNNMDEAKAFSIPQSGQYISQGFKDAVKSLDRIGQYKTLNADGREEVIDILIVHLKKEASLKRARTTQRNYIAKYLKEDRGRSFKDGALVAFISPDEEDWRFSLIQIDYRFDANGKVKDVLTPARRFSFLVGKNESSHTAQSCLLPLLKEDGKNPSLKDLEEAFSVEKVTREFFEKYRALFHKLKESLDKIILEDNKIKKDFESKGIQSSDFAKKLLGQIVFLYFLQKKGWFGVERGKPWGSGSKRFLRELFKKRHQISESMRLASQERSGASSPENSQQTSSPDKAAVFPPDKDQQASPLDKAAVFPPDKGGRGGSLTDRFFNDILEPLFYEALAKEHTDDYYSRFDCRIPFLNGGLFEPLGGYDWVNTDILLPDSLFSKKNQTTEGDIGDGILDIFDRYNFTVNEDEPLEKEVAVDPEMLGKVFENLLEGKDRKSKGAYYTPREIVHYMCRQSLIHYLVEVLKGKASKEDIEKFIENSGSSVEHDTVYQAQQTAAAQNSDMTHLNKQASLSEKPLHNPALPEAENYNKGRRSFSKGNPAIGTSGKAWGRYAKAKLPESIRKHALQTDQKLDCIRICDPAVGSGAFPVGMMHEIVRARCALTPHIDPPAEKKEAGLPSSDKAVVFPPDKDQQASPLDKAAVFPPDKDQQASPPDKGGRGGLRTPYHFKRHAIEHSLYGVDIDPAAIEIAKLRLWLSLVVDEEDRDRVQPLPNLDYKIVCGNSILGMNKDDGDGTIDGFYESNIKELHKKKSLYFNETSASKKQNFKKQIDQLIEKACVQYIKGDRGKTETLKAFDFEIYFSEVFQEKQGEKQGFDIVIANPPYIQLQKDKGKLANLYEKKKYITFARTGDIYILFYEIGCSILNKNGTLCFITSNKWMTANYGKKFRNYLLETEIIQLIDMGPDVFQAMVDTSILLLKRENKYKKEDFQAIAINSFNLKKSNNNLSLYLRDHGFYMHLPKKDDPWAILDPLKANLKYKIYRNGTILKDNDIRIYRGVTTGCNTAFIIDSNVRNKLIKSDITSNKIIKPLLQGKHLRKWTYSNAQIFLIFTRRGINIKKYKKIENYLLQFKERLIPGNGRKPGNYKWYEIQDNTSYYNEFEKEKIIWSDISTKPAFSICKKGVYFTNTVYMLSSKTDKITNKYLIGILNSSVIDFYFPLIATGIGGKAKRYIKQFVEMLPVPIITDKNRTLSAQIEDLTDKVLSITKTEDCLQNPAKQAKVREYEKQIDLLVYKLYNLTSEEIKIIENEVK